MSSFPEARDCTETEASVMRSFIKNRQAEAAIQFFASKPDVLWGSLTNTLSQEEQTWFRELPTRREDEDDEDWD